MNKHIIWIPRVCGTGNSLVGDFSICMTMSKSNIFICFITKSCKQLLKYVIITNCGIIYTIKPDFSKFSGDFSKSSDPIFAY